MVVENLTDMSLPPPEAAKYAIACGARVSGGTDMKRLSQCLAEDFGLTVRTTDDVDELLAHLKQNGIAVANVGGDRPGYKGVFSDGGHYLVALCLAPDGRVALADPGLYAGKYQKPHRRAAEAVGGLVYAQPDALDKDAQNRSPRFTLFAVK